jgi:polar amino acid ABC transporter
MRKIINVTLFATLALALCACAKNVAGESTTAQSASTESMAASDKADKGESKANNKDSALSFDNDGKLTVGFDKNFPPMGFVGSDGEFTGFDLDLAKEAAKRMGLEIVYQPIAWDAKDMELNSGTIDVIWNGFTMTGREDAYLWSEPYMENSQVFVVRKDSGISDFSGLKDKIVEVQSDSSAEAVLEEMKDLTSSFKELKKTPDYNTGFMDLESGAIDALAMDEVVAAYQLETRDTDDFIILDKALATEQYAVGLAKNNKALRDKLQAALDAMQADGTISKISNQWFGKDVSISNK